MMLKAANWSSYQSYKDRKPPWIRFHKSILDNYEYQSMTCNGRALLPMLWLLASEHSDPRSGIIDQDIKEISFRLRLPAKDITIGIDEIVSAGFFERFTTRNETVTDVQDSVTPETEERQRERQRQREKNPCVEQARQVFTHWQTVHRHPRSKLDLKRQKAILARLKDGYSVDDLNLAVDGCRISPFHQGQNDGAAIYDDIELICRTASNIDKFIKLAGETDKTGFSGAGRRTAQSIENVLGGSHAMAQ